MKTRSDDLTLADLLAYAEKLGCACGAAPCLIHYMEQQRRERGRTTKPRDQEEFYVRKDDRRRDDRNRDAAVVPANRGGNRNRSAKPVRQPAGKPRR